MNCSPTLTAEEFKTIHNALWELDRVTEQLEDILKPELFTKLSRAGAAIRKGLESAYEQDDQAYRTKSDHFDAVQAELGLTSNWSIYEVDNLSDRHPYEGADRVVYTNHWGELRDVSCSINGLTWAALWRAADACIRDSGDEHHVFIEGFRVDEEDPRTLILFTGS